MIQKNSLLIANVTQAIDTPIHFSNKLVLFNVNKRSREDAFDSVHSNYKTFLTTAESVNFNSELCFRCQMVMINIIFQVQVLPPY